MVDMKKFNNAPQQATTTSEEVPFIDSNELGSFKIEKFIRRGVSLGAK